jgi:hypothetical protein
MNIEQQISQITNGVRADAKVARGGPSVCSAMEPFGAAVIVNADDWGLDRYTTGRSLDCFLLGAVSSVSAMVFMEDSERAADLARQRGVDAGLHLNLTLPFSAGHCPAPLKERQERLSSVLSSNRFAPAVYHPFLAASFEYVVKAQLEEYERLYGRAAKRLDGHHHMHLCANVLMQELLPEGAIVRRNLSFARGEKGFFNRVYRHRQDRRLARRHRLADFFFDLQPMEPRQRLEDIFDLAERFDIEVETHPVRDEEYRFLTEGELMRCAGVGAVARGYVLRFRNSDSGVGRTW